MAERNIHDFLEEEKSGLLVIQDVVHFLLENKWVILIVTLIFAVASVSYSLSIPNKYKSTVLLAPATSEQSSKFSGIGSQLGGLASLAGINLSSGSVDKTALALEIIRSRQFVSEFVKKYGLAPVLMGATGWDAIKDEIVIDPEIYDTENAEWKRDKKFLKEVEPSSIELHEEFVGEVLRIARNEDTGFLTISIISFSPESAKKWADLLLIEINDEMRKRDIEESTESIRYLEKQLAVTDIADSKKVLYQLIEEQSKTLMLASVRDEYVFKTIDPAFVPEEKDSPKRAIICIVGTIAGFFLAIIFLVIKRFIRTFRNEKLAKNR